MDKQRGKPVGDGAPRVGYRAADVPAPAVRRLSFYLRQLETFLRNGRQTVSSRQLGQALGLTDTQVRKDLAYFGQFGHPGIGYRVEELILRVRRILGTDRTWNVLIVGAGNLGNALMAYRGFARKGFQLVAVLDNDPAKIGQPVPSPPGPPDLTIRSLDELEQVIREKEIRLGVLCVPAEVAQSAADRLIAGGVKGILNFAPVALNVPESVAVSAVDLAVQLEQLSFRVSGAELAEQASSATE